MELRRIAPPTATTAPPPPRHRAPRPLPLPSAQAPSKKRRVSLSPSPPNTATPTPAPPPPPALATSAPAAASLSPYSLPQAQGDTHTPAEPAYVDPATAPRPAADEKPSTPSPPAADEEPSALPAAARPGPLLAWEAREMERKVIIRNPVPEGALAAGKATAAAAAVGALPTGEGCAPDKPSSRRNAALDEAVDVERNVREMEADKLASVCNAVDVDEEAVAMWGGTLISKPVANADSDACEAEELVDTDMGKEGCGMSERQRRRMTEVFVCGLNGDMKEEDVRSVFGLAGGEITKVRMAMDARTSKSKGYCFLRYREPSQAKKVVAQFSKFEICWKLCQIETLDGNDTIVLENIDKKWKKEDIMKLLHKTGVENIDTITLIADFNNPGYNCGYAFVELKTERDAWMAYIKLSRKGVFSGSLNIAVAWAKPMSALDEEMQQVKSIFVEGMPDSWDNSKMTEIFSKYGVIQRTVLSRDIQSAKRSDFAFVHYTTHEAAFLCLESFDKEELTENGSKVNIKVSLAKPIRKGKQMKEDKRISNTQKSKTKVAQTCQVQERDDFLQATQGSLLQAQEHAKPYYNIKHTAMAFSVGDWVWVKLLHRPVVSMPSHTKGKLGQRFYGPYQVLERIGDTAYRLQLQPGARIHDVFHVGVLEPFSGTVLATASPLPPMQNVLPVPVSVLRSRLARGQWQVLVHWEGLPVSEASWEDAESFRQHYPTFAFEDELFLKEGRDVMVGMKYHRRQHG